MLRCLNLDANQMLDPNCYQVNFRDRLWNVRRQRPHYGVIQFRYRSCRGRVTFYVDCHGINCCYFEMEA